MSFHSFRCHSNIISSFWCHSTHSNLISSFRCHSIHSDVILFIPMSFHSFRCHFNIISSFRCDSIHSNLIPSFWRHSSHSDVIPVILSCLRWPRNDFISEWREWPWNANFSHSRLILVILCYLRWSRKDGIFPFSSLSFRCHSVIRTSFWDQESIEMRSEWQIIWGRSRQSSLKTTSSSLLKRISSQWFFHGYKISRTQRKPSRSQSPKHCFASGRTTWTKRW